MKKIVAFLLTFVMLFTMVACSSASGSNPTTVPKPSGDASGAISEGSDGKRAYYCWLFGVVVGPGCFIWFGAAVFNGRLCGKDQRRGRLERPHD